MLSKIFSGYLVITPQNLVGSSLMAKSRIIIFEEGESQPRNIVSNIFNLSKNINFIPYIAIKNVNHFCVFYDIFEKMLDSQISPDI